MTTPRQIQIARRWHHELKLNPHGTIDVARGDLKSLVDALWVEIDRANAAEDRLANKPVTRRVPYLSVYNPGQNEPAADSRPSA